MAAQGGDHVGLGCIVDFGDGDAGRGGEGGGAGGPGEDGDFVGVFLQE